jgi:hypothetical protein
VGIDCPLGWPRAFVTFVSAHAANRPLPAAAPNTEALRLRATDVAVLRGSFRRPPLSVSTDLLGITALRTARLLAQLVEDRQIVDRSGVRGLVCEVYPAASRAAWGLSPTDGNVEHTLDQAHLQAAPAERNTAERARLRCPHSRSNRASCRPTGDRWPSCRPGRCRAGGRMDPRAAPRSHSRGTRLPSRVDHLSLS